MTTLITSGITGATGILPIHLDTLEVVANWRLDLAERIKRTRLRYEAVGVSPEEIIALSAEKTEFELVCRYLRGEISK